MCLLIQGIAQRPEGGQREMSKAGGDRWERSECNGRLSVWGFIDHHRTLAFILSKMEKFWGFLDEDGLEFE